LGECDVVVGEGGSGGKRKREREGSGKRNGGKEK
jgi:hypothetical protein